MPHEHSLKLASTTSRLERSVMRELLAYAVDPKVISLAGGLPPAETVPVREYSDCLQQVLAQDGPAALQYSPQYPPLQEWIAARMKDRGAACSPGQVFITNGAQQGLAILSRLFLDPGEAAVVEEITFTGVQQVTRGRGAEVRPAAIDPNSGVKLDSLESLLAQEPRPGLAVLIPTFHNPLSATMPAAARQQAAQLSARYSVPLLEDDPYSELRFEGEASPPIKSYDEAGTVFYLGSFSKTLAPAVRLGWIVAPEELIPRITVLRESLDLESSTLTQRAVFRYMTSPGAEERLKQTRQLLRQRRDAMLKALNSHLIGLAEWTRPQGGLFIWLTLNPNVDAWDLFERAIDQQVAYIPGGAFSVGGGHRNTIRLSFGNVSPERIEQGIERLGTILQEANERAAATT